ncbi:MAG: asparagine synthase, glutamine-hydrolyzing [Chthoniobacteraceae bacterium]|nr:asparagine synthase, glutamine-hydrolyzing [Chthoniobacteraceae bacterium]
MCGIAGFAGNGDLGTLRAMTDAIRHRGPDAEGFWHDAGVFLGHRRLSIVDLAGGSQPMWSQDGELGVVFNGEIYNHNELRAELKGRGHHFVTDHSDTEVLLHGYREWGEAFVERLNGMWAFVLFDRKSRSLFGSRDRFGKKPLYYFNENGTFGFGSELPALLAHPASPRSLSALSLQKYFAYCYIPAPRSIYERVWKLPGGHSFRFDLASRELKTWRYWEFVLEPDEALNAGGTDLLCEEIRDVLERAVKRRLMSDVPLGVFLSGGIDSSSIAALAAKHVPELNTFSIGFNEPSFDESSHARLVAQKLGTRHHEEILDLDKAVALLPEIVARLDEPLGDGSLLPTYLLSRFTRQHVTVALGGDGADELFAGYDPMRALQAAEIYSRFVPRPLHGAIRLMAGRLPVSHANISFDFKIKRTLMGLSYPPQLWNPVWMGAIEPSELGDLFGGACDVENVYSEAIEAWDRCAQPNLIDRALQFWTTLYLQDGILAKVDRASMMPSLEARSPFLDIEFVDLARRIPHQLKLRGGTTKWILKRALAPLLPREIIERPKKGFGMPIGRWLREDRFDFSAPAPAPVSRAFLDGKLAAHRNGKSDERLFLWCAWLLNRWMQK